MGARQSVAQSSRPQQRPMNTDSGPSSSSGNAAGASTSSTAHCTNGHTIGDQSTSAESVRYRTGFFQSSTPSTSQQQQPTRVRQIRSCSVTVPSPDFVRSASLSTPLSSTEQAGHHPSHTHRHAPHFRSQQPILLRDQSSDSSADNDGNISTGMPSLDRLLRLNSMLVSGGAAAAAASSSSTGTAVWLPSMAFRQRDVKCPVCRKTIPSDDVEYHLVVCLTRPRIAYNEDILTEDKGECVICFEEMSQGDTIARLPCLCVYHKMCIDSWFKVKNCCPEHPGDD